MIEVKNIVKKFDKFYAVNNLCCNIPDGSIFGIVGSNGAGKSTFLRMLAGVYRQNSGEITLDGKPIWENPSVKSQIVFVADEIFYLPNATMKRMASLYRAVYPDFDYDTFDNLMRVFNLDPKMNLSIFSKGMRRQASVILALSTRAKYFLFDETFDGLDPVMRNLVKKLICDEVAQRNATVIITSHSLRELEDICDQLALVHKGALVLQNDIQNLKTNQFKVQIAFNEEYDINKFEGINIVSFRKYGCVANMIVKENREDVVSKLTEMQPAILEVLPLSLEEVFTFEMEALGYSFENFYKEV